MANLLKNLTLISQAAASDFLKIAFDFKLGNLPTEQPSPQTQNLSQNAASDLPLAISQIKTLDNLTLSILTQQIPLMKGLFEAITRTLENQKRVFMCGCGATGRLSLALEALWRQEVKDRFQQADQQTFKSLFDSFVSFMAGGDCALIKSVEDFEDHPEFAVKQMEDLNFSAEDFLIANTEGGETPWVIGATEYAASICAEKPYFLYCNPDEILVKTVERSKRVIENNHIRKINLTVGHMAITGSTRMQSTTILMYYIGLAMFGYHRIRNVSKEISVSTFLEHVTQQASTFSNFFSQFDEPSILKPFIDSEYSIYQNKGFINYQTDYYFSLSIMTDTTERSPTFSLVPFENDQDVPIKPSLCHIVMLHKEEGLSDPQEINKMAWFNLLGFREFRCLEGEYWSAYKNKVSLQRILGHDVSLAQVNKRKMNCPAGAQHSTFLIQKIENKIILELDGLRQGIDVSVFENRRLDEHILLKILLNTHSTLVMAKMNRVNSNIMVFVRPTNNKLIDRAIRYVQIILEQNKDSLIAKNENNWKLINYDLICHALFYEIEHLDYDEAIVWKIYTKIKTDLFESE